MYGDFKKIHENEEKIDNKKFNLNFNNPEFLLVDELDFKNRKIN